MKEESKIPKFVTDLTNYLIAIKNLSKVYVKNMTITVEQFLDFLNIHILKNKYNSLQEFTLNDIRSLKNSDIRTVGIELVAPLDWSTDDDYYFES